MATNIEYSQPLDLTERPFDLTDRGLDLTNRPLNSADRPGSAISEKTVDASVIIESNSIAEQDDGTVAKIEIKKRYVLKRPKVLQEDSFGLDPSPEIIQADADGSPEKLDENKRIEASL